MYIFCILIFLLLYFISWTKIKSKESLSVYKFVCTLSLTNSVSCIYILTNHVSFITAANSFYPTPVKERYKCWVLVVNANIYSSTHLLTEILSVPSVFYYVVIMYITLYWIYSLLVFLAHSNSKFLLRIVSMICYFRLFKTLNNIYNWLYSHKWHLPQTLKLCF